MNQFALLRQVQPAQKAEPVPELHPISEVHLSGLHYLCWSSAPTKRLAQILLSAGGED